jgi:hypothetical protein
MSVRIADLQLIYGVAGAREKFEELCDQLIRGEHPPAASVRSDPGDGGIDTYVGDWSNPTGIDVYQAKFFPTGLGDAQKGNIRRSFRRASDNSAFRMKTWTLCLPCDLSADETGWFWEWVRGVQRPGLDMRLWTASTLEGLLYKAENGGLKEAFFRQEHLTQIRELHAMLSDQLNDIAGRVGQPAIPSVRNRLVAYIRRNLEIGRNVSQMLENGTVPVEHFDTETWSSMSNHVLVALPNSVDGIENAVHHLRHANRLVDEIDNRLKNPKYDRVALEEFRAANGENEIRQAKERLDEAGRNYVREPMLSLLQHLEQRVIPELEDILREAEQPGGGQS